MALATRCPHCDTVFRLDPHLLAPHDGRVRCGHCQEIFDAAHYQFERDETVMAALAATAPNYDAEPASPWAAKSSAEVAGGQNDALGIPLHPFVSDTTLAPHVQPEPPREEPLAGLAAEEALSRTHAESDFPGEGRAESPWQAANRAEAEADEDTTHVSPADAPDRTEPFVSRTEGESVKPSRTDPFMSRAEREAMNEARTEPFVGRTAPRVEPEAQAAHRTEPAAPWAADPEPRFGSASPPFDTSEPFPVIRETRAPARSGIVWKIIGSLIALVLLVALIAQLAWWQRETVMVYWPASQPFFVQTCEQIGCVVAPPRDIDGLQIENSGLRQMRSEERRVGKEC
jgi:predicted Zn finger-like uncharacterized protein